MDLELSSRLRCSVRLVRPFLSVLRVTACAQSDEFKLLDGMDPDRRIALLDALRLLEQARLTGADPALGLKAALALEPGDLGAVEYAVRSDATVLRSLHTAARYGCLLSDAMSLGHEVKDGRVHVRVVNTVALPRSAQEFQLGALITLGKAVWPEALLPELEAWLPSPQVASLADYHRVFAPARLHFGAAFVGLSFAARHLEDRLHTHNANFNRVMRRHMELELARLQRDTHAGQVRSLLVRELPSGGGTAKRIAALMRMSVSTLGRRLEAEGTCFNALREEQRQSLTLSYLSVTELSVAEIAELAGFSQTTAFRRAFKRWTGKSPQQYRTEQRSLLRARPTGRALAAEGLGEAS